MGLRQWFAKAINLTDAKTFNAVFGDFYNLKKTGNTGYVAACIDTMGWAFSKAKFRLYESQKGSLKELYEHGFLDLIKKPNDFQVFSEMKYYMGVYLAVYGNYYLLVLRGKGSNKPARLTMLDPNRVIPKTDNGRWIDYYEYNLGTKKVRLEKDDVIHLRMPSQNSVIKGEPIINRISEILDVDSLQMSLMKKFYKEGGFLGAIFTTNASLNSKTFDRALQQLKDKYSGTENAFKVALFEQGLQPIKAAYSIRDMELNDSRRGVLEEVMTAFKIPKILLGGSSESYTKASADAAMKTYADNFLDPALTYIDENISDFVRREWNNKLTVKHDSLSPRDIEGELAYNKGYFSLGALTINEIRISQDYEPLPYTLCDKPLLNVGGAVLDVSTGEQLGTIPNNRLPVEGKGMVSTAKNLDEDYKNMKWRQFDRRYSRQAKLLSTKVDEYFERQKKELLEILNKKSIDDIISFFDSEDEYLMFRNLLENELLRIIKEGYSLARPGTPFNSNDSFVKDVIFDIVRKAKSVNDTTKSQLIDYIKDRANLSNIEIAALVKEKFDDIKESRVSLVVNTTVTAGMNAGLLKAFRDAGAKYKIWLSMRDNRVRDSHVELDGQKVLIDEPFEVNGELIEFPGDPNANVKQAANCRCTILGE